MEVDTRGLAGGLGVGRPGEGATEPGCECGTRARPPGFQKHLPGRALTPPRRIGGFPGCPFGESESERREGEKQPGLGT